LRDVERSVSSIAESEVGLDPSEDEPPIEVRCEVSDEALPVCIDAMMLKRCVDNLVRNAIQAIRRAGRGGSVRIAAGRRDGVAVLTVSDDGPGIPADQRVRVFDPYFTTRAEGTGLGLAIVKKVVLEHGGEIRCREAEEGGAAFDIHLPVADARKGRAA
jgi:signal transduction histidine kinase